MTKRTTRRLRVALLSAAGAVVLIGCCVVGSRDAAADDAFTTIEITGKVAVDDVMRFGVNCRLNRNDRALVTYNFEGAEFHQIHMGTLYEDGLLSYFAPEKGVPWCGMRETGWAPAAVDGKVTFISGPLQWQQVKIKDIASRDLDLWGHGPKPKAMLLFEKKLNLPGGKPIEAVGLMIELSDPSRGFLDKRHRDGGHWNSEQNGLVQGDTPPDSFGKSVLKMDGAQAESHFRIATISHKAVDPRGRWHLGFWAKAKLGNPKLVVETTAGNQEIPLTTTWKQYHAQFDHKEDTSLDVLLKLTGGLVLVDDIVLRGEQDNPTVYYDDVVQGLKDLDVGLIRGMQLGGRSMDNALAPRLRDLGYGGSLLPLEQTQDVDNTIHETYTLCEHLGCEPWYTLPGALKPEEMLKFMEYIGAPADVGAGKIRADQGHPKPWTETFTRIHVEFGNEPWNWVTPYIGNGFTGPDYWESLIGAAKKSPYYKPSVIFHVAGRSINKGGDPVDNTPNADRITWAPYIVHTLPKELEQALSTDEMFFRWVFTQGVFYARDKHERQVAKAHGAGKPVSLYEINHHCHGGTASNDAKRKVKSAKTGERIEVTVNNGELVWASPMWITYRP